jgi:hypothetical protein
MYLLFYKRPALRVLIMSLRAMWTAATNFPSDVRSGRNDETGAGIRGDRSSTGGGHLMHGGF